MPVELASSRADVLLCAGEAVCCHQLPACLLKTSDRVAESGKPGHTQTRWIGYRAQTGTSQDWNRSKEQTEEVRGQAKVDEDGVQRMVRTIHISKWKQDTGSRHTLASPHVFLHNRCLLGSVLEGYLLTYKCNMIIPGLVLWSIWTRKNT